MEKITNSFVALTLILSLFIFPINANEPVVPAQKVDAAETTTEPVFDPNSTFTGKPAYDESLGGFVYEEDGNGGCIITGYNEFEKSITIPSTIGDLPVRGIGETAFYGKESIVSVTIPEGVTYIATDAFGDCLKLATVNLPSTLVEIGHRAFRGCEMLRNITLPEGLTTLGDFAFEGCIRIRALKAPTTLSDIGIDAFSACSSLILDTSANEYAAKYAEQNAIPTTFADTTAFSMIICGIITAVGLGAIAVANKLRRSGNRKKSSKG